MKRREFLKYGASTLVAGSFGATAARPIAKPLGRYTWRKSKRTASRSITSNKGQGQPEYGERSQISLIFPTRSSRGGDHLYQRGVSSRGPCKGSNCYRLSVGIAD